MAQPPSEQEQRRSVASMRSYADRRQELDKLLARIAEPAVGAGDCSILDAGCGVGHLAPVFRELNPRCRYHGADQHAFLIDEATAVNADDALATFEVCDVDDLLERHPAGFDVVVSWKVLMAIPDFSEMLPSLIALTRRHLFVASLFYEGDIDFHIRASDHTLERQGLPGSHYYNVYSLPRFEAAARELGARAIDVHPFEIGIDLPRGEADAMGTYTERLADGRRVQFSGALHMPWKVIQIDV
jgi:SAM-dependent methyltransferase